MDKQIRKLTPYFLTFVLGVACGYTWCYMAIG